MNLCSFVAFDFHEVTKGGHYEHISLVRAMVAADLQNDGFFLCDPQGATVLEQRGVV
jgi:hypothetical protein